VRDHVVDLARDTTALDRHSGLGCHLALLGESGVGDLELAGLQPHAADHASDDPRREQPDVGGDLVAEALVVGESEREDRHRGQREAG